MNLIKPAVIKILIVEDNLINAVALKDALQGSGNMDIMIVPSSEKALKIYINNFDLIFLDIQFSEGINGIQLCKLLRNTILKKDTPIICYSNAFESNEKECLEAGMNDFLPKPFSPEDLKDVLECWLPTLKSKTS